MYHFHTSDQRKTSAYIYIYILHIALTQTVNNIYALLPVYMFYTICVFCTVRVWYVPYAYGTYHTRTVRFSVPYAYGIDIRVWYVPYAYGKYHTRTVRFSVPYAYGIDIRVWYVPYAYYAFSQYLLVLPSPSYNGLSLQAFLHC